MYMVSSVQNKLPDTSKSAVLTTKVNCSRLRFMARNGDHHSKQRGGGVRIARDGSSIRFAGSARPSDAQYAKYVNSNKKKKKKKSVQIETRRTAKQ